MSTRDELIANIMALTAEGGSGNRLVVTGGRGWAVLSAQPGAAFIDCELATNGHLSKEHALNDAQLQQLRAAGYVPPARASSRLRRPHRLGGGSAVADLADELLAVMDAMYSAAPGAVRQQLALEDAATVDNPKLIRAMRKLSKVRSHEARIGMYQELINARLLLATGPGDQPKRLEKLGEWDVFSVFTDYASVQHHDPRIVPHRELYGHELFPMLMRTKAGALKINPDGMVGGELFRNELETLARAVGRFGVR